MRQVIVICLLFLGLSCITAKKRAANHRMLNGTWIPIKQLLGDKELPTAVYAKQKLIINDSNYTVIAESIDKGILRYTVNKMDIYGKEGVNAGKHFTAIYKYTNDELTICYNLRGDQYPEIFETNGKPLYFLSVFKNEMTK